MVATSSGISRHDAERVDSEALQWRRDQGQSRAKRCSNAFNSAPIGDAFRSPVVSEVGNAVSEPRVLAVMLTKDRPAMARQAVEAFRRQKYGNLRMLILNNGSEWISDCGDDGIYQEHCPNYDDGKIVKPWSVGELRNAGNTFAHPARLDAEIICHFDDDDLSHPNRIAEQVALLESSGADAVGYRHLLFWREPMNGVPGTNGEAWVYTGAICGTSLCYWRKTWEANQFPAVSDGEDTQFITGLREGQGREFDSRNAA